MIIELVHIKAFVLFCTNKMYAEVMMLETRKDCQIVFMSAIKIIEKQEDHLIDFYWIYFIEVLDKLGKPGSIITNATKINTKNHTKCWKRRIFFFIIQFIIDNFLLLSVLVGECLAAIESWSKSLKITINI